MMRLALRTAAAFLAILGLFAPTVAADSRIGGSRTLPEQVELASDSGSRNLYVVARWGDSFTFNLSTDGGLTWSETWASSWATTDVDLAVMGGHVYVACLSVLQSEVILYRFSRTTGLAEAWSRSVPVTDWAGGNNGKEVALTSDLTGADETLYLGLVEDWGRLRAFYLYVTDPDTVLELPTDILDVTDAEAGLDMDFNDGGVGVYFSYLSTDSTVHVARWVSLLWEDSAPFPSYSGNDLRTRVSAHDNRVVVGFDHTFAEGTGLYTLVRNRWGASSWGIGEEKRPPAGGDPYFGFDVSADGNRGWAAAYGRESTGYDPMLMATKAGYGVGPWVLPTVANQVELRSGTQPAMDFVTGRCAEGYGLVYVADDLAPYFTIHHDASISCDGFASGDLAGWSAHVP